MTTSSKVCPVCGNSYGADDLYCPRDRSPLHSTVRPDDLVGTLIGDRYMISERIGAGGMGEVYRAQDVRLQRAAAVKVLRAPLAADLESLMRFHREASNAARINDPHVVQVYDYGETDQRRPFLAMEYVAGPSLRAILDRETRLEPARVAALTRQIATGLEAAHRLDIIHRDLKPDNVLVWQHPGGGEVAKVVDFGISKALRDDSQRVTRTGFVAGTCEFMSPEQVGGGPLDRRSDVYSLGLVAYLMLAGTLPFQAETVEQSMLLRLSQPPRRLREAAPGTEWPEGLESVFDRVLARMPAHRYASASEFATDLETAIRSWQSKPGRRRVRMVLRAALPVGGACAAVVAALIYFASSATRAGQEAGDLVIPAGPDSALEEVATRPDSVSGQGLEARGPETGSFPGTAERASSRLDSLAAGTEARNEDRASDSTARPRAPGPEAARQALRDFGRILHPDIPRDSVAPVLDSLSRVVRHLITRRDSVDAEILRAEAYGKLERFGEACAVLDRARQDASPHQRRKIQKWVDLELCSFPDRASS